jgi:metal-responsive CopG/Arc/MetJ family transcriptional regulator
MGRPRSKNKTISIGVSLPPDLLQSTRAICKKTRVPVSALITALLSAFVEDYNVSQKTETKD